MYPLVKNDEKSDMIDELYNFNEVTLLITHYNRSSSLERLLCVLAESEYKFGNIIVSDDASDVFHVNRIKELQNRFQFQLASTPVNKGLANNINKGQKLVKTPLTLYIQEDFVPKPLFKQKLRESIALLRERPEIDMVRFYAYFKYPYLKPYKQGFSEMLFKIWYTGYKKFYLYSDHPHLRRSDFLQKFGEYEEGIKSDAAEYKMMMLFLRKGGKALFYDNYRDLFDQINSSEEPSTVKRNFWRNSHNGVIVMVRHLYRHLKFNFDYIK